MSELDLEEERLLSSARHAFAPDDGAKRRVLAATLGALQAPAMPAPAPGSGAGGMAARTADVLWHAPGLGTRLVAAVVLSLGSAVVGYSLGVRHPEPAARAAQPSAASAPADTASAPRPAPEPAGGGGEEAASAEAEEIATHTTEPRVRRPAARARRGADGVAAAEPPIDADLRLELETLKRVETAQRAGRTGEVLSLLRELDERVPHGQLLEERRAAFVIARCALGLGHPVMLTRDFTEAFPDSVYETRVRQRCLEEAP